MGLQTLDSDSVRIESDCGRTLTARAGQDARR